MVSPRLSLALVLPFCLFATQPAPAAVKAADVIGRAIDGFVRPAYDNLRDHAAATAGAMKSLCNAPSQDHLDDARGQFAGLVSAWSNVEIIHFGPITVDNRLERMLFWPDRKGIGLRQVQAAIAAADPTAADPAGIAGKSVAMQGLGALEFVLYGTGADTLAVAGEPFRCTYGKAVAGNIEQMSADVSQAWDSAGGFAAQWAAPGPDNPLYRNGNEAVTQLVGVFIEGLEQVRDVRLKGFLGRDIDSDKPRQAIYWRSGLTADSLAANLSGMDALFEVSKLGDALPPDLSWIADSIHIQLVNGAEAARTATGPIDEVLADPARRDRLDYLALVTSSLSNLFGTRMTAAFGLTAGFSSLDGDEHGPAREFDMRTPLIDRRDFLKAAGAGFAAAMAPAAWAATLATDAVFATAYVRHGGGFGAAVLSETGKLLYEIALPERGHDVTFDPVSRRSVVFPRKPGTVAVAFDHTRRERPLTFASPANRHFYGHGVFSPDGALLYATENDFDNAAGMVGIYDARDGFHRVGEFPTHGIGPHELLLAGDGRTLVVANGGIETHPDFGKAKLNLATMQPSYVLIDRISGDLIEKHQLPPDLHKLSIRHMDFDRAGTVWFSCQYEGATTERPPLVGRAARGKELELLEMPEKVLNGLHNYIGAMAANREAGTMAVSSPAGNSYVVFDTASGKVVSASDLTEVCGIAPDGAGFMATSGAGAIVRHGMPSVSEPSYVWDNHLLRIDGAV